MTCVEKDAKGSYIQGTIDEILTDDEFSIWTFDCDKYDYKDMSFDWDSDIKYIVRHIDTFDLCPLMRLTIYGTPREGNNFDGSFIETRDARVNIIREIPTDICIAKEIEYLNNIHNINTISSCCGHGNSGHIVVHISDAYCMRDQLGYIPQINFEKDENMKTVSFDPKSACTCVEYALEKRKEIDEEYA